MTTGTAVSAPSGTEPAEDADPPRRTRGWRPALRIARRTVRRSLGRSLLVAALVAIPVAGAALVDGVYRSTVNPERETYQAIGNADGLLVVTVSDSLGDLPPDPSALDLVLAGGEAAGGTTDRDPADVDVATLLPPGTDVVPRAQRFWSTRLERGEGTIEAAVYSVTFDHSLADHQVRLMSGSWPSGPGEVLVTEELADRLGLLEEGEPAAGTTVALPDGPVGEVTGVGLAPTDLRSPAVFAAPESSLVAHLLDSGHVPVERSIRGCCSSGGGSVQYLVDLPEGVDPETLVPDLARSGAVLVPRAALLNPGEYSEVAGSNIETLLNTPDAIATAGLVALVAGLGLLEVVLLAGAAFAVGAKRQVRDLGLVAAGGGTSAHVRRIVLAQGLVMGVIGAAIGLACGVALTVAGRPLWEYFDNALIESWRWGGLDLAVAAGVGLLSGLAAAVVPAASAARLNPIDALAQRFRSTPLAARLPTAGVALIVLGASGALVASRVAAAELDSYAERLEAAAGTGTRVTQPDVTGYIALQLLGAVTTVAGLIMVMSFLLTRLARRAGRLPMSARYAARDAARHRHRTTPAVAAIMIVVAGATGVACGLAAQEEVDELRYVPSLPPGTMAVRAPDGVVDAGVAGDIAGTLPDGRAVPVTMASNGTRTDQSGAAFHESVWLQSSTCEPQENVVGDCRTFFEDVAIATPELLGLAYGSAADDGSVQDAIEAGKIIVPSRELAPDGEVTIETWDSETGERIEQVTLEAHVIDDDVPYYRSVPRAYISSETATAAGWDVVTRRAMITYDESATPDDLDAAHDIAGAHGHTTHLEPGRPDIGIVYIALAAGTGLVTLVGVGVVVSLAAAEGRADLATMAAVGAPPRRRRAVAGWQALFVGGLGSVLGLALGLYYGYLTYPAIGSSGFIVPWLTITTIGLGVPALAGLVAVVFNRSRLPMVRRIE